MKKYFLIILLIATVKSFAQNSFIGVKGGVNASTIVPKYFYKTGFRIGFSGCITYQYLFKKGFLLGADILYDQRGFTESERWGSVNGGYVIWYDSNEKLIGEWLISEYRYNYLSIPIKAGFQFGKKRLCFSINGGVISSLLMNAKSLKPYSIGYTSTGAGMIDWNISNERTTTKALNFSGFAEMEIAYKLKGNFWLTSSLTYQHDILIIDEVKNNNNYYYKYDYILHGMTLALGVKWALKKE